jgi:CrcB protein
MAYVWAAVGGVLGALGRWGVATALAPSPGGWPWATLLVNLTGCLLIGALAAVLATSRAEPWARPLLAVGLLGGWTTYSAFAVETVLLARDGAVGLAAAYVVGSVAGGLLAVVTGVRAGRALAVRAAG